MRIRIDFADAAKYVFDNGFRDSNNPVVLNATGKEIESILAEDYFNGADKAVIYIGYSLDNEYFELDLIPNI